MTVKIIKYKPYKSVTNGGEPGKIYVQKIIPENLHIAIEIRKFVLSKEEHTSPEFALVKKFKDRFLYQEFITLKHDTLMTIASTVYQAPKNGNTI